MPPSTVHCTLYTVHCTLHTATLCDNPGPETSNLVQNHGPETCNLVQPAPYCSISKSGIRVRCMLNPLYNLQAPLQVLQVLQTNTHPCVTHPCAPFLRLYATSFRYTRCTPAPNDPRDTHMHPYETHPCALPMHPRASSLHLCVIHPCVVHPRALFMHPCAAHHLCFTHTPL